MMAEGDINAWLPENDLVVHQALGKLLEELAELSKIAARCIIQGIDEREPVSGAENLVELMKEIADVQAAITWLTSVVSMPPGMSERGRRKLEGYRRWQALLEATAG